MYSRLKDLFYGCFQRRVRIRRMALRAEALAPPEEQLSLFDFDTLQTQKQKRMQHLSLALDRLRERFGPQTFYWGSTRVASTGALAERSATCLRFAEREHVRVGRRQDPR